MLGKSLKHMDKNNFEIGTKEKNIQCAKQTGELTDEFEIVLENDVLIQPTEQAVIRKYFVC